MIQKKPIYTTFSWIRFLKDLTFGIIIISVFLSNVISTDFDNKININAIAFGIFLLIILILFDSKELAVYDYKVSIKRNYLFGLISQKTDFELSNIRDITFSGKFSKSNDLTEDFLSLLLPIFDFQNTLIIKTFDNKTHEYKVRIYKEKLEFAIDIIKKSLSQYQP